MLILIGVLLILYQTDLLDFSTADVISYGFVLIGVILLANSINRTDKRGILGGVFFTLFGITMILMREYTLPRDDEFGFAAFFIALALGNFAYLPFKKDKTTNLIWGIVFGALGGLLLWVYYGYYPSWYIYEQIEKYWPVILIVIGASLIIKAYAKRRHAVEIETQSQ
jgi:peptidoglycan/LPS O-acetylase OafA/YrhL